MKTKAVSMEYKMPKKIVDVEPTKNFGGEKLTVHGLPPRKTERWESPPSTFNEKEKPGETIANDEYRKQENRSRHSAYRK